MTLTACAQLVERGDPDRFLATMAAPVSARNVLFPLYAFNLEVARAPWVTEETMIAEMRLQWWRDALEEIARGGPVRKHEVTTPLAAILPHATAEKLDTLVAARRWDIYKDPFEDQADFDRYIDETSGNLLWAAATTLGQADETTLRDLGYAQGVANWLRAIPDLEARQRIPLLDGTAKGIAALADAALTRLRSAQANRHKISPAARPALLAAWEAKAILTQAARSPQRVAEGTLGQSPARKRLSLMAQAATGRW
ncbi:squalene/phytoene synthase family protein [Aestuariivita boseongensis]|uniref:squalene/phytoene synthase family protein n=1 Tax=Aestuariivita boseongensis TaxID=1470562 RepID=UPI000682E58C|nr:squalene/phytoene synthase family protein [Aestuariivita boseongensis]